MVQCGVATVVHVVCVVVEDDEDQQVHCAHIDHDKATGRQIDHHHIGSHSVAQ